MQTAGIPGDPGAVSVAEGLDLKAAGPVKSNGILVGFRQQTAGCVSDDPLNQPQAQPASPPGRNHTDVPDSGRNGIADIEDPGRRHPPPLPGRKPGEPDRCGRLPPPSGAVPLWAGRRCPSAPPTGQRIGIGRFEKLAHDALLSAKRRSPLRQCVS